MTTLLGIYKGFVLYLCVPWLAQDDAYHDEKMLESFIIGINHVELEDSHSQAIESITEVRLLLGVPFCL